MTEGTTFSKRYVALCSVAIGVAILMAWLCQETAANRKAKLSNASGDEREISRQIAARSAFADSDLAALRLHVDRFQVLLGPEDQLATVVRGFGSSWDAESNSTEERNGFSVHIETFRKLAPRIADWSKAIDLLGELELLPGVGIARFEMRTIGDHSHRSVDFLKVVVEIHSRHSMHNLVNP